MNPKRIYSGFVKNSGTVNPTEVTFTTPFIVKEILACNNSPIERPLDVFLIPVGGTFSNAVRIASFVLGINEYKTFPFSLSTVINTDEKLVFITDTNNIATITISGVEVN